MLLTEAWRPWPGARSGDVPWWVVALACRRWRARRAQQPASLPRAAAPPEPRLRRELTPALGRARRSRGRSRFSGADTNCSFLADIGLGRPDTNRSVGKPRLETPRHAGKPPRPPLSEVESDANPPVIGMHRAGFVGGHQPSGLVATLVIFLVLSRRDGRGFREELPLWQGMQPSRRFDRAHAAGSVSSVMGPAMPPGDGWPTWRCGGFGRLGPAFASTRP